MKSVKFLLIALTITAGTVSQAQISKEVEKKTPQLPGEITMDLGLNFTHDDDTTSVFNSRSYAAYFIKSFNLGKRIEFRPGVGWASEKLFVKKSSLDDVLKTFPTVEDTSKYQYNSIKKAGIAINYLEIPLEFRYNFRKSADEKGFFIGLGGIFSYRIENHSKMKYIDTDRQKGTMKIRSKDLDTNKIRYGVFARVGYRGFNLYYKYYFSDVFENEPSQMSTIGISVTGF